MANVKNRQNFQASVNFHKDPSFEGVAGMGGVRYKDVTLTTAQVKALNATPITLVAAPGAGYMLVPVAVQMFLDYNSAAYDGIAAGEDLAVKYTDGSGAIALQVEATGFLDASADARRFQNAPATILTPVANAALVLHMLAGEIATGNSPLLVRTYYRKVTVLS